MRLHSNKSAVCALYAAATTTTSDNYNNDDNGHNYNVSTPLREHSFTHTQTHSYKQSMRINAYMQSSLFDVWLVFVYMHSCFMVVQEYRQKRRRREIEIEETKEIQK